MHGSWERTTIHGDLLSRTEYRDGDRHGPHHDRRCAHLIADGHHADDVPNGRWAFHRHDDSLCAEVDVDAGVVGAWRWLRPDGTERECVAVEDFESLQRWLALGEGWDRRSDMILLNALEAFDETELSAALAWLAPLLAAKPLAIGVPAMDEPDLDERRFDIVNQLVADHMEWTPAQLRQIVARAPQLKALVLYECSSYDPRREAEPSGVDSLLAEGDWSRLEALSLVESCDFEELVALLEEPGRFPALRELDLGGHDDDPLAPETAARLAASDLFGQLERVSLKIESSVGFADALRARPTPLLERLELRSGWDEDDEDDVDPEDLHPLADPELRPRLSLLRLEGAPNTDLPSLARPGLTIELGA